MLSNNEHSVLLVVITCGDIKQCQIKKDGRRIKGSICPLSTVLIPMLS